MCIFWPVKRKPEFLSKGVAEITRYSVLTKELDGWGEEDKKEKKIQPKVDLEDRNFHDSHFNIKM